jgi:hypothetical protein
MSDETPPPPRTDWRAADIRGMNMSCLYLPYADFRGSDCRGVNFSGSNLPYSDWRGVKVDGANFQYTILYGAKMQGIEADGTDFRHSDMRQSNMAGAYYLSGAMMPKPTGNEQLATPEQILAEDRGPDEPGPAGGKDQGLGRQGIERSRGR